MSTLHEVPSPVNITSDVRDNEGIIRMSREPAHTSSAEVFTRSLPEGSIYVNNPDVITLPSNSPYDSPSEVPKLLSPSVSEQSHVPCLNLEQDRLFRHVLEQANDAPATSALEKSLNRIDDIVIATQNPNGSLKKLTRSAKSLMDSDAMKAVERGISSFAEELPWLMKSLDEVARIHPVVTVVVLAFKTVYNMELTRRENDQRIQALYLEMKDMMSVLIQLRDVKDANDRGPDGKTIEARLQRLMKQTAEDIKNCAHACDTYAKKRLLVKVLKGYSWEAKLVEFAGVFARRRSEFEQALAIHTARTVDAIRDNVHLVQASMEAVNAKLELFTRLFEVFAPQDLVYMKARAAKKGDIARLLKDNAALKELNDFENGLETKDGADHSELRSEFTLRDLREELREDLDGSLEKSFDAFEGKFKLYNRQLQDELTKTIDDANNRVISAFREGPHDRIKDPELRMIWKEMNWRRNVKARLFVVTLRDHFQEKLQDSKLNGPHGAGSAVDQPGADNWASQYISLRWLQPIMDAFDDDGSGYVTIAELNQFTDSIPRHLGWGMEHWLAYWAVGWQFAASIYAYEIQRTMSLIFALRSRILPENRWWAYYYLKMVWPNVVEVTAGLQPSHMSEYLPSKFQPFIDYEQDRIRRNLQDIRFNIDTVNTVHVVAGSGRIEKSLLPMLYLLLDRDLKLFRVAQTKRLHNDELWDSASSIKRVVDAASSRMTDLRRLYQQQKIDLGAQFNLIACGLFSYVYDSAKLWSNTDTVLSRFSPIMKRGALNTIGPDPQLESVSNYPATTVQALATSVFETRVEDDSCCLSILKRSSIFGQWSGYIYNSDTFPEFPVFTYILQPVSGEEYTFQATGDLGHDEDSCRYHLKGHYSHSESGIIEVHFVISYDSGAPGYYNGHLDEDGSLVGSQTFDDEDSEEKRSSLFIFRKVSPEIMIHRPSPGEFAAHKSSALWKFAKDAVMMQARRRLWSWSFFKARRDLRRRSIALRLRIGEYGPPLSAEEREELLVIRKQLEPAYASLCNSLHKRSLDIIPRHYDITCDACYRTVGGGRVICLDCERQPARYWQRTDFCSDTRCYLTVVPQSDLSGPHLPTHDMLKIRTLLQWQDLAFLEPRVQHVLSRGRRQIATLKEQGRRDHFRCSICRSVLTLPCWYCTKCIDEQRQHSAICDACEAKSLLPCIACRMLFEQPSWYYGENATESFLCNKCTVKGIQPPHNIDKTRLHTHVHPLVRCHEHIEDRSKSQEHTMENRLALLESNVREIRDTLVLLQQTMAGSVESRRST